MTWSGVKRKEKHFLGRVELLYFLTYLDNVFGVNLKNIVLDVSFRLRFDSTFPIKNKIFYVS